MRNKLWRIGMLFLGCLVALALSAATQQASAQGQPTAQPSAGLPVEPPNGWDSVAWARFRSYCLDVAQKSAKHSAMTISEIQTGKMCMAYARPSLGEVGRPPGGGASTPNLPQAAANPRS